MTVQFADLAFSKQWDIFSHSSKALKMKGKLKIFLYFTFNKLHTWLQSQLYQDRVLDHNICCIWRIQHHLPNTFSSSGCLEYGSCKQDEWAVREDVDMLLMVFPNLQKVMEVSVIWEHCWTGSRDASWQQVSEATFSHEKGAKARHLERHLIPLLMEEKQWVSAPFPFPCWLCISENLIIGFQRSPGRKISKKYVGATHLFFMSRTELQIAFDR